MRNFRSLTVWQKTMALAKKIYNLCELLPKEEKFGFTSQLHRAAVSMPSNIAEGCSRSSERHFLHFLEISLGSSFEIETQLLLINDLNLIESNQSITLILKDNSEIQKMLGKLIQTIKKS